MTQAAASGSLVAARYALASPLGASDLSQVYGALDQQSGRPCAVKLFLAELGGFPEGLHAFQQAAISAAALRTAVIVPAIDFGFDTSTGRPFVVTEHIELPSLTTLIRTRGPLSISLFGEALQVIGSALEAGISIQLSHGSLKPQNLFLSPERPSIAKVSDFGISRLRFVCPPPHGPASLGWSSPEQLRGSPPSLAADVFSLGLTAFYALVGRHYLRTMWQNEPEPSRVLRELADAHPSASEHARALGGELPAALDDWFARAFSPTPSERFNNASDAVRAFGEVTASLRRVSQKAPTPLPGSAAAVAAPLIFQELPRPASAHDGVVPQTPSLFGAASSASTAPSQPPPSGGNRPNPEHVAGLPSRPPLGLLAVVGVGLIGVFGLAGWGISRLFKSSDPASPTRTAASSHGAASEAKKAPVLAPQVTSAPESVEPAETAAANAAAPSKPASTSLSSSASTQSKVGAAAATQLSREASKKGTSSSASKPTSKQSSKRTTP